MTRQSSVPQEDVSISTSDADLAGFLAVPEGALGLVLFAHGSGSSRFSKRNQYVGQQLQDAGLATLLFDLLTPGEHEVDARTREFRFDIPLIARRLTGALDWTRQQDETKALSPGLFGASTGAAAALVTAAERPETVAAVVSRGGRPDLAAEALPKVKAPSLFIVGALDTTVIGMNKDAARQMDPPPKLEIVDGASHLFEEPGALEKAAMLARDFFLEHLG